MKLILLGLVCGSLLAGCATSEEPIVLGEKPKKQTVPPRGFKETDFERSLDFERRRERFDFSR